jgi:hypothetical protein
MLAPRFCIACGHDITYTPVSEDKAAVCPECGRAFTADDPSTFLSRSNDCEPPSSGRRFAGVVLTTCGVLILAAGVLFFLFGPRDHRGRDNPELLLVHFVVIGSIMCWLGGKLRSGRNSRPSRID